MADEGKAAKVVQARTFHTIVYSQNGPPVDPGKWWHSSHDIKPIVLAHCEESMANSETHLKVNTLEFS